MNCPFDTLLEKYKSHPLAAQAIGVDARIYRRWRAEGFSTLLHAEMVALLIREKTGIYIPPEDMVAKRDGRAKSATG